ncbi:MAG: HAD family hydrolase [Muribaculaceae bacterium]
MFTQCIKQYLKAHNLSSTTIKAALIDMDGVLYDSMKNHTLAWKMLADHLGIEATRDEFYLYEGMTGVATINLIHKRQFGTTLSVEEAREIYKIKTANFRSLPRVEAMPGAYEMLTCLRDHGIERVLVTGSGQADVINRIDCEYQGLFSPDMRITAANVTHGKPDPEPYIMGQRLAGVLPHQAIVIENAPLGVKAGHSSGSFTVAVTTGPIPQQAMSDNGANIIFSSMQQFAQQLPLLIEQLNSTTL